MGPVARSAVPATGPQNSECDGLPIRSWLCGVRVGRSAPVQPATGPQRARGARAGGARRAVPRAHRGAGGAARAGARARPARPFPAFVCVPLLSCAFASSLQALRGHVWSNVVLRHARRGSRLCHAGLGALLTAQMRCYRQACFRTRISVCLLRSMSDQSMLAALAMQPPPVCRQGSAAAPAAEPRGAPGAHANGGTPAAAAPAPADNAAERRAAALAEALEQAVADANVARAELASEICNRQVRARGPPAMKECMGHRPKQEQGRAPAWRLVQRASGRRLVSTCCLWGVPGHTPCLLPRPGGGQVAGSPPAERSASRTPPGRWQAASARRRAPAHRHVHGVVLDNCTGQVAWPGCQAEGETLCHGLRARQLAVTRAHARRTTPALTPEQHRPFVAPLEPCRLLGPRGRSLAIAAAAGRAGGRQARGCRGGARGGGARGGRAAALAAHCCEQRAGGRRRRRGRRGAAGALPDRACAIAGPRAMRGGCAGR